MNTSSLIKFAIIVGATIYLLGKVFWIGALLAIAFAGWLILKNSDTFRKLKNKEQS
jgi:hypothetical protein